MREPSADDGPLRPARFRRILRRADSASFAQFVADIYRARGWAVSLDGPGRATLRQHDETGARTRVLAIVHARTAWGASRRINRLGESVDLAVTNVPVAGLEGQDVRDPDDLYRVVFYGMDRSIGPSLVRRRLGASPWRHSDDRQWAYTALPVVLVTAVVIAAALAWALVAAPSTPGRRPTVEPHTAVAGVSTRSKPTAVSWRVPPACPRPPAEVSPSAFQPDIVGAASASGMDGWRRLRDAEFGRDRGRLSGEAQPASAVRYVATYEEPGGARYRFRVDRWRSVDAAMRATERRAHATHLWLRIGPYTLSVTGYTSDGRRLPKSARAVGRTFLASVSVPNASEIGRECVAMAAVDSAPSETRSPGFNIANVE